MPRRGNSSTRARSFRRCRKRWRTDRMVMASQAAQSALASPPLDARSIALRRMVVRTLAGGERGHVGSSMSLVEIMRVLYDDVLRYRPQDPKWGGRDRVILSKGHGCIAQ